MHGTVEIVFRQGYIFLTRNWEKYKVYVYNQLVKEKIQCQKVYHKTYNIHSSRNMFLIKSLGAIHSAGRALALCCVCSGMGKTRTGELEGKRPNKDARKTEKVHEQTKLYDLIYRGTRFCSHDLMRH